MTEPRRHRTQPPEAPAVERAEESPLDEVIHAGQFHPLDEDVEREIAFLRERQTRFLLDRWKGGWSPRLPEELDSEVTDWRATLDSDRIAGYCAAASGLIRRLLLDASGAEEALGRIESPSDSPTLDVFAYPDSLMAAESNLDKGGAVRLGPEAFAQHIAQRCAEPLLFGDLAWRFLAPSLVEAEEVLPRLAVRPTGAHAIEVRLQ